MSCNRDDEDTYVPVRKNRTLLAYMIADNTLNDVLAQNIVDMYKGMTTLKDTCTLLVFWDGESNDKYFNTPCIIKYETFGDGKINDRVALTNNSDIIKAGKVVKTYSVPQASASKECVTRVLKDMISISRTKEYGLIMASHASGWLENSINVNSRSFGQDGTNTDNTITIPDLKNALMEVGCKFRYVLFDACMMGNIESCYELRNTTDYIIASPMEVPGEGYRYDKIIPSLFGENVYDYTSNLCKIISLTSKWGNYIAVNTSELERLCYYFRNELKENEDKLSQLKKSQMFTYVRKINDELSYDGMSYDIKRVFSTLSNDNISYNFLNQINQTIISCEYILNYSFGGITFNSGSSTELCGMGMYVPTISSETKWKNYFKTLEWANASGWNDILEGK